MEGEPLEEKICRLVCFIEQKNQDTQAYGALTTLLKLIENILNNRTEPKFRSFKANNKAIETKVLNVIGVQELILALGWNNADPQVYVYDRQDFDSLEVGEGTITIQIAELRERVERNVSKEFQMKEKAIKEEQARKESERQRMKQLFSQDRKEQAKKQELMPTQDSIARQRNFGANTKTCKDIGIDVNKKKGG